MNRNTINTNLIKEYKDGEIVMESKESTTPFEISTSSLTMIDNSMQNMKEERVSEKVDLSKFTDNEI
jgi:hypothetical protein